MSNNFICNQLTVTSVQLLWVAFYEILDDHFPANLVKELGLLRVISLQSLKKIRQGRKVFNLTYPLSTLIFLSFYRYRPCRRRMRLPVRMNEMILSSLLHLE